MAMNDKLELEGLVLSGMVFGDFFSASDLVVTEPESSLRTGKSWYWNFSSWRNVKTDGFHSLKTCGFEFWTIDIIQAYLQSTEPLTPEIFIGKTAPELEVRNDQRLKLLRPLYDLCDSGDFLHDTINKLYRHELHMKKMSIDHALY